MDTSVFGIIIVLRVTNRWFEIERFFKTKENLSEFPGKRSKIYNRFPSARVPAAQHVISLLMLFQIFSSFDIFRTLPIRGHLTHYTITTQRTNFQLESRNFPVVLYQCILQYYTTQKHGCIRAFAVD